MELIVASISPRQRQAKSSAAASLVEDYVARAARYTPTSSQILASEQALLALAGRTSQRSAAALVLGDAGGDLVRSEEIAEYMGRLRDGGTQRLIFALGPADGWSAPTRAQAQRLISFGRITLPHELARVVLAEQVYRALTILAGHPYHCGH